MSNGIRGTSPRHPWLNAVSCAVVSATYPIGALVDMMSESAGTDLLPDASPKEVIDRAVALKRPPFTPARSTGVAQGIVPFQFSSSGVGVPPLITLNKRLIAVTSECCGTLPSHGMPDGLYLGYGFSCGMGCRCVRVGVGIAIRV